MIIFVNQSVLLYLDKGIVCMHVCTCVHVHMCVLVIYNCFGRQEYLEMLMVDIFFYLCVWFSNHLPETT